MRTGKPVNNGTSPGPFFHSVSIRLRKTFLKEKIRPTLYLYTGKEKGKAIPVTGREGP
jgi:hypothetical protein